MNNIKKILVLGIGNILQKDDGIGVHVVNFIIESGSNIPDDVEIIDGGTAGYDLLSLMQGREKIIIIDALKVNDESGSVYRFTPDYLKSEGQTFSLHDVGMRKIIDMLGLMGRVPKIEIIGIVPEDIDTFDIGLSRSVQKSVPHAVEQIFDAITN